MTYPIFANYFTVISTVSLDLFWAVCMHTDIHNSRENKCTFSSVRQKLNLNKSGRAFIELHV